MVALAVSTRSLSSHQRSPFARRILSYIRSFDPPISEGELARRMGVKSQAFNAWMHSKAMPRDENVRKLADILGCTEAELRYDLDNSRNWVPPVEFDEFVGQALMEAKRDRWPDLSGIEKYLTMGRAEMWRDQDSVWAVMAKDILSIPLPTWEKAHRIAHLARAWERMKDDPELM